jgi:hypothetical protein
MKFLNAGYIEKVNSQGKCIYLFRYVTFKAKGLYFAICLENSILADSFNEFNTLDGLIYLLEDDLKFRAQSEIPVETVPAQKKYFDYFNKAIDLSKNYKQEKSYNYDKLAKKYFTLLNPEDPRDYELRPLAV